MPSLIAQCSEQWPEVTINLEGTGESATHNTIHADVCPIRYAYFMLSSCEDIQTYNIYIHLAL